MASWFEVFKIDEEEGTETIYTCHTEDEAIQYIVEHPEYDLDYDEWYLNPLTGSNELKQN